MVNSCTPFLLSGGIGMEVGLTDPAYCAQFKEHIQPSRELCRVFDWFAFYALIAG